MGILTNPANREILANASAAPSNYLVDIGGKQYEVIDGDTIREAGVEDAPGLRITRREAAEVLHYAEGQDGETALSYADVGGEYEKDVLFNILSEGEFDSIDDLGAQQYGRGAGKRKIIDIKNSKTGQGINEYLLGAGLVDTGKLSTQLEVDAYNAGILRRQLYGEDKYKELRDTRISNRNGFKKQALNPSEYITGGGSDVYSGIANQRIGETAEGFTTSPIATAFSTGTYGLLADLGGSLNALGVLTGNEWLQEKGQFAAFINNERADRNPYQEISRLSDIGKSGDDIWSKTADAFQWLGVNATQSAPFLLALAGSAAVTGGVAGALGASAAAAGTAGSLVSGATTSAFHTGEIWNNIEVDKRTGANAAKALTLGTFAGTLDRLSFGALAGLNKTFKPSTLLSKDGRKKVVDYIADKRGLSKPDADKLLKTGLQDETAEFLKDGYQITKGLISKQRIIQDALIRAIPAIGTEASTEVLQELTTYLTAQGINQGVSSIDDIYEFVSEELLGEDDELREILLNAGAAGGVIGGGFSVIGSARQASQTSKLLANLDQSSSAELAPIAKVYYDNAPTDNNIVNSQINYGLRTQQNEGQTTEAFDGGVVKGYAKRLKDKADKTTAVSRIVSGEKTLFGESINQIKRLYKEEILRVLPAQALSDSQALRNVYSFVSGVRGTHAGQSFERAIATGTGTLKNITNSRLLGKAHNFNFKNIGQVEGFSDQLYLFGELTHNKNPESLTDAELSKIGISRKDIPAFAESAKKFERRAKLQLNHRIEAAELTYGIGSPKALEAAKSVDGWWWKHRGLDLQNIISDPKGFQKVVEAAVRKKDLSKLPDDQRQLYNNPAKFAEEFTEALIQGRPLDSVFGPEFSFLEGGARFPTERTLNLSEQNGIKPFLDRNIFSTLDNADLDSVRNAENLRFFGDGGANLDLMLNDAAKELSAAGYTDADIDGLLSPLSQGITGIIDAAASNYNTIKNPTLRKVQQNLLMYTGFIGMSLSAPASIPEYLAVMVGVRNHSGLNKYAQTVGQEFFDGVKRLTKNTKAKATGGARIESQFYDLLQKVGVPNDAGYFQRKFGTGEEIATGKRLDKVSSAFYWGIGLQGITEMQRVLAAGTGVSYIQSEAEILMNAGDRLDSRELNSDEIQAYSRLQELGIDVHPFINALKASDSKTPFEQLSSGDVSVDTELTKGIEAGILAFVNTRIQNPGAANRPLLLQDPRYRLLTQFNGFISAVTTTLVPKIWNDNIGRGIRTKHPSLTYDTFAVIIGMILLGGVGQWLKDLAKFGESTPYLDTYDQLVQRAIGSSGVLGQGEKLLELFHPLYAGENLVERGAGVLTGSAGRTASSIGDLIVPKGTEGTTPQEETFNDVLKLVPGISNLTGLRNTIVDRIL